VNPQSAQSVKSADRVSSHAEADLLLRRKCEIRARLDHVEARMNERIDKAKAEALAARGDLDTESARIDRRLKQYFATLTPEQLGDRKSVKLNFGTFGKRGGREAVKLVRGWTWDLAIAALRSRNDPAWLRVVTEVNKAAILAAPPATQAEIEQHCGLRVEPGDTFYVEPDVKALAEYAASEPRA